MRNYNTQNYNIPNNVSPLCAIPEPRMVMKNESCGCDREPNCENYPIGMAYVPWQTFRNLHEPEKGLEAGTIFMELEKPFYGKGAFRR